MRAETRVGLTIVMTAWKALPGGEESLAGLRGVVEDVFLQVVEGDFLGVQCYTGLRVGPDGLVEPRPRSSGRRWATRISPRRSNPRSGERSRSPVSP